MNTNNRRNRNTKSKRNGKTAYANSAVPQVQTVRIMHDIAPSRVITNLRYAWTATQLKNSGFQQASYTLRANAPYDPDSAVGSGATAGFNEWAGFYLQYRVRSIKVEAEFNNLDPVSTFANISFTNQNPASNTWTQAEWQNDLSVSKRLGQSTGSSGCKIVLQASVEQIVGDNQVVDDRDWCSTTGTVPNQLVYCVLAIDTAVAGFTMTNGALVRLLMTMETEFFERKFFTT